MTSQDKNFTVANAQLGRWRSTIVAIVIGGFSAGTASGLVLYFLQPFIGAMPITGLLHWVIGLAILAPYCWFQWRHYQSNRNKSEHLHYKVGLWTFFSVCAMTLSGLPLILSSVKQMPADWFTSMAHIFASFVFIMLVCGHLVLVGRITLARAAAAQLEQQAALRPLLRAVIWVPVVATLLFAGAAWLLS